MRIEFREVGQRVASDANGTSAKIPGSACRTGIRKKGSTRRFPDRPFPYAKIFGDGVAVISDDLESVGILGDEPIMTSALENGQNVGRLDGEPLSAAPGRLESLVWVTFELERIGRIDPPEQPHLQGITGLEVTLARIDVLGHADLDRGAPFSSSP